MFSGPKNRHFWGVRILRVNELFNSCSTFSLQEKKTGQDPIYTYYIILVMNLKSRYVEDLRLVAHKRSSKKGKDLIEYTPENYVSTRWVRWCQIHIKYIQLSIYLSLLITPSKFNSSPLKNGAWKTILSYWVSVTFQGRTVKLREGNMEGPKIMVLEKVAPFKYGHCSYLC